jgi:hypothetical protein
MNAQPRCRRCLRPDTQTKLEQLGGSRARAAFLTGAPGPAPVFQCADSKRCKLFRIAHPVNR